MRPLGLSRQELWSAGPDRLSGGNGRARRRCAWGSWGGPRRGRVQICCKGVPGREKRRMKARNINGSSREPRLDPGLCNRFGQTAPPRTPARTAAAAITPTPGRRDAHFALERALLTAHLESEMHVSTSTGPTRPHHPGRPRPVVGPSRGEGGKAALRGEGPAAAGSGAGRRPAPALRMGFVPPPSGQGGICPAPAHADGVSTAAGPPGRPAARCARRRSMTASAAPAR